jgi:hypothetical protein
MDGLHHDLSRIDCALVHRSHIEHVFISPIQVVSGEPELYEADVIVDQRHVFFYEHPLDHVPGLLLVEAVRQMGTAVTHLYYGAPNDSAFVLNEMMIKFSQFAEHSSRLQIKMRIHDVNRRRGRVASLRCASAWWQSDKQIGTMDALWSVYDARTMSRLRAARGTPHKPARVDDPEQLGS